MLLSSGLVITGCKKAEVPNYKQELIDLGFSNPESSNSSDEIPIWTVYVDNTYINVMRDINGKWIYDPLFEENVRYMNSYYHRKPGIKLVGLVKDQVPRFRVHCDATNFAGYKNWKFISKDGFGGGDCDIYKISESEWSPTMPNPQYKEAGYIPNVSVEIIKKLAAERYKDDPYGHGTDRLVNDFLYSTVWDFHTGKLKE